MAGGLATPPAILKGGRMNLKMNSHPTPQGTSKLPTQGSTFTQGVDLAPHAPATAPNLNLTPDYFTGEADTKKAQK